MKDHSDHPRIYAPMLNASVKDYDTALYSCDNGMWTIYEIVKRPIAKVASEAAANDFIRKMKVADLIEKGAAK